MKLDQYTAFSGDDSLKLSGEYLSVVQRRTLPFLDSIGLQKPLAHLLCEAYLQGVKDAVETMEHKK